MHIPAVQHTLFIFEQLCSTLPPLVPDVIVHDMQDALEQMRHNYSLSLDHIEQTLIVFGKQIWPYRQAFDEFLCACEGRMGESFFLASLPPKIKQRFAQFLSEGGTYRDLHRGTPATFFTSDERVVLCERLVAIRQQLRRHTEQEVLTTERSEYEARILEFQHILDDMEKRLNTLRIMADNEQEHPGLAAEIREQVKGFEYGLCALGPHVEYSAVCEAQAHLQDRKRHKQVFQLSV